MKKVTAKIIGGNKLQNITYLITYPKYLRKTLTEQTEFKFLFPFSDGLPDVDIDIAVFTWRAEQGFFEKFLPMYEINYYPENRPEATEPSQATIRIKSKAIELDPSLKNYTPEQWKELNFSEEDENMQDLDEEKLAQLDLYADDVWNDINTNNFK